MNVTSSPASTIWFSVPGVAGQYCSLPPVDGGDHTRLAFLREAAGAMRLVLNPEPWQITGQRIN